MSRGVRIVPQLAAVTLLAIAFIVVGSPRPAESSFPGYNGRIVFTGGPSNDGDQLSTVRPDGTGLRQLTFPPGHDMWPSVSADGTRIVFVREVAPMQLDLFIVDFDGAEITHLPDCQCSQPSWSPAGDKLALGVFDGGDSEIALINADGSGLTILTNNSLADSSPRWSPDGDRIAFVRFAGQDDIYLIAPDGTQETNLTNSFPAHDSEPDWAPDGDRLVFMSDRQQPFVFKAYTMDEDGSNATQLSAVPGHAPIWSPDGSAILSRFFVSGSPPLWITDLVTQGTEAVSNSDGASNFDWAATPEPLEEAVGGSVVLTTGLRDRGESPARAWLAVSGATVVFLGWVLVLLVSSRRRVN